MTFAKITQVAHSVPKKVVSNDDLSKIMDTNDEWIYSRTGIKNRHISTGENTSDLAADVAQKLLTNASVSADSIDFIIVATITPDSLMPSTAARVQAKIGAINAFAYDLTAACSGFVFALSTAEKLLASGNYKRGIVIGAEVFSKIMDWSDRSTAVLFGDGAGGVLLENTGIQPLIIAEKLQTDGSRGDSLLSGLTDINTPFATVNYESKSLSMEGRAIFDFAVRDVPKNIKATLEEAQISSEEIDFYLLHQANSRILDKMAKKLGVERSKFLQNMQEYGNTSAASIPLLLSESVKNGIFTLDGKTKIVLTGFGGGLTWGTTIINL
ncbi:beta-ketoacyl-ACP synthase III [Lactococcus protaetiae]|uniref:Beta-ketoacyl-[acyl-carrier-protein] synthase III n=1 Tax=Lactococcus protaetiae TaxID=2592653 RepID=A0A514Z8J4_9LACT|nr:beta-ketoacyl-ACP synthase III [Lactococcus protaetiae]MCL2112596.1 ketoacyl-ACP synthase III [Streptococcaceae bacterium]QDK70905.1 ketoacyl-ACP synthase III [Lactococcus protaetiae]